MSDCTLTEAEMTMCRDAVGCSRPGEFGLPIPVYAVMSGAHVYGWADEGSDYDVRGIHVAQPGELLGIMGRTPETVDRTVEAELFQTAKIPSEVATAGLPISTQIEMCVDTVPVDIVTHEVGKFARLIAKPNGNFLEMLFSPIVLKEPVDERIFNDLRDVARGLVCQKLADHYLGFYAGQKKRYSASAGKRLRQLLYGYRVLFTGIHAMRSGEIVAHLPTLLEVLPFSAMLPRRLMKRKMAGKKDCPEDWFVQAVAEQDALCKQLEIERDKTHLLETPIIGPVHNWLVRYRMLPLKQNILAGQL